MGCSNSEVKEPDGKPKSTTPDVKEEPNKKISNNSQSSESEKKNELLLKENKIDFEKSEKLEKSLEESGSTSYMDLPNYDLFEKFIKLKKVQEFIQNVIYEGYGDAISGIFKDIKPLIDELFKRFGITYEIIKEDKTINCSGYNVVINKPDMTNSDFYLPLFFLCLMIVNYC